MITNHFKFCPRCKTKLKKKEKKLIDCFSCNFHFYLNPAITNAIIFENKQEEILLVKRKISPKKGFWDLPGGFIDSEETVEESVKREVKEELGIKVKKFQYLASYTGHYFYKEINYQTLCLIFKSSLLDKKITPADDVESFKFFPKTKIPFTRIAFIEIKNGIRDYLFPFKQNYSSKQSE